MTPLNTDSLAPYAIKAIEGVMPVDLMDKFRAKGYAELFGRVATSAVIEGINEIQAANRAVKVEEDVP